VKIKVYVDRAGLALNFRNPDGSAHYSVNANLNITVIPPEKKFRIPRANIQASQVAPPRPTPPGQVT
jgi:hypothetical protein